MNRFDDPEGEKMDTDSTSSRVRMSVTAAAVCIGFASMLVPQMVLADDGGDTIAQPPVVTVIFDTSSSMQWTEEDGGYPELEDDGGIDWSLPLLSDDHHLETWEHGTALNLPGSEHVGEGDNGGLFDGIIGDILDPLDGNTAHSVGPCAVWHAQDGDGDNQHACDQYHRPSSCAEVGPGGECREFDGYVGEMEDRLEDMRDSGDMRLDDEANTPRHIQVKQILTGDMSLAGSSGPGCWFVPRARGALHEEQICCEAVGQSGQCVDPDSDQATGSTPDYREFDGYVDYDEPIPHYQEVYDEQTDGMLDGLASTAIFSVAMFDGYPTDGTRDADYAWEFPIADIMAGDSPYDGDFEWATSSHQCNFEDDTNNAGDDCYDMGLFRFVGPRSLNGIGESEQHQVSDYVQEAILDAGFLAPTDADDSELLGADEEVGELEDDDFFTYPLGKQPMAQASPFGPVFHDLHQFYLEGQYDSIDDEEDPYSFNDDPYRECRARHSVIMTDGMVEPEAPGGAGDELGSEVLTGGGFGYDEDRYPYKTAEQAIEEMVEDLDGSDGSDGAIDFIDERYIPRVHVMGVSVVGENDPDLRHRALDKMAAMAEAGNTCAQAYLGEDRLEDEDGNCDEDWCLARQDHLGYDGYTYDDPSGEAELDEDLCEHPALVLTNTDRGALEDAFGMVFNEIAGTSGIEARTRPAVTSDLDRDDTEMGQYRFFSGFEVQGDNRHWRGLMRRRLLACEDDELEIDEEGYPIHEDFVRMFFEPDADQFEGLEDEEWPSDVVDDEDYEDRDDDRRRVFTSIPDFLEVEEGMTGAGDEIGDDVDGVFNSWYSLMEGDDDVFDDDGIRLHDEADNHDDDHAVQTETRVPFEVDQLKSAFQEEYVGDDEDDEWYASYWGVDDEEELEQLVDSYRGRVADRIDRSLGAVYSSDPVAVGPPSQDLPIDSYRQFRRDQDERLSMLYTSTVDGQLRAIHAGEPDVQVRQLDGLDDQDGEAYQQREAWAYVPQLVHSSLAPFMDYTAPDGLMDGAPVVEDVRLCTRSHEDHQTNPRVCTGGESGGQQWRTVLLQGMGMAGSGYFAMDVTRTGDDNDLPDPVPMWEFGPDWEMLQIQEGGDYGSERYHNASDQDAEADCDDQFDEYEFKGEVLEEPGELSFMGSTVGEPEIGVVNMTYDNDRPYQRPVAVFGAGTSANADPSKPFSNEDLPEECVDALTGRAIYVVDLQSGEMIRRFTGIDKLADDHSELNEGDMFPAEITGTPVMSGSGPADLSTRGFIGDEDGRMYRIDFSEDDSEDWEVSLFYDPADDSDNPLELSSGEQPGPAAYQPAVTVRGSDRNLVLVYGLADRGDSTPEDSVQGVIALQEDFVFEDEEFEVHSEPLWAEPFGATNNEHERLTGPPLIFNNDAYFTTYFEEEIDDTRCGGGGSRIWRLDYQGDPDCNPIEDDEICDSEGSWPEDDDGMDDAGFSVRNEGRYIQQSAIIRGVDITMGPDCERNVDDAFGSAGGQQPQLVAQTAGDGAAEPADDPGEAGASEVGEFDEIAVDIEPPDSQAVPLNWSVIEQ